MALELALFPSCSHNIHRNFESHQYENHGSCENQQPSSHNLFGIPPKDPFPLNFQWLTGLQIPLKSPIFWACLYLTQRLFSEKSLFPEHC